jgi:O-antigen ligase
MRDNNVGLGLALSNPILGVGVNAPPTTDFVVIEGKLLYVHNEFLYAWLHYGLPGLGLVVWLVVYSTRRSVHVLRRAREARPSAVFGASVLVAALPGYWFFPHMLTLDRFALLLGWSIGAVAAEARDVRGRDVQSRSEVSRSATEPLRAAIRG